MWRLELVVLKIGGPSVSYLFRSNVPYCIQVKAQAETKNHAGTISQGKPGTLLR